MFRSPTLRSSVFRPVDVPVHHVAAGQRRALAVLLGVHGLAHLAGTTAAIAAVVNDGSVDYWFGTSTLDDSEVLLPVALLWTVIALGFLVLGVLTWHNNALWRTDLAAVSLGSVALCTVALPTAVIGLLVDVALLALLVTEDRVTRFHPFRHLEDR